MHVFLLPDDSLRAIPAVSKFSDITDTGVPADYYAHVTLSVVLEPGYANNPNRVLVARGETRTYSFEALTKAIRLINAGARFICTNPDETGPSPEGVLPATGSVAALITKATGVDPYFVGKPNPLMMREALNSAGAHSETAVMIGDRMDTDIVAGMEAGMETILVLTGLTDAADVERYPYRPTRVVKSIADLIELV